MNKIAIDSILGYSKAYEVDLAEEHLSYAGSNDLVLLDRNYTSYRFLSYMRMRDIDFVSRCSRKSFKTAQEMFEGKGRDSQIVTLFPPNIRPPAKLMVTADIKEFYYFFDFSHILSNFPIPFFYFHIYYSCHYVCFYTMILSPISITI